MNKVLVITIKNSNNNLKSDNVVTNELIELNAHLEDGWTILSSKVVTLKTGALYFSIIYNLHK